MMRRYQSAQSRFYQPDPYNGSYDLTNPRSFNRYAYVNDDPVNLVDPNGLELEGPTGYVEIQVSFDGPITGMFWRYIFFLLVEADPPTGRTEDPGGVDNEEAPQDSRIRQRVDDCTGFANTIDGTAASPQGRTLPGFLDVLARTFVGARNSSPTCDVSSTTTQRARPCPLWIERFSVAIR